jgi:hypothetical protein
MTFWQFLFGVPIDAAAGFQNDLRVAIRKAVDGGASDYEINNMLADSICTKRARIGDLMIDESAVGKDFSIKR